MRQRAAGDDTDGEDASAASGAPRGVDAFDLDELNRQPVMSVLLRCIEQLRTRGLEGRDEGGMPIWMGRLLEKMSSPTTGYNVRLVIAKLVYNLRDPGPAADGSADEPRDEPTPAPSHAAPPAAAPAAVAASIWRPHAARWAQPLLQLAFESIVHNERCHYFARDLLQLVCSWPADALPQTPHADALLSHTLERLMLWCRDPRTDVLRANVHVVKALLQQWGPRMQASASPSAG